MFILKEPLIYFFIVAAFIFYFGSDTDEKKHIVFDKGIQQDYIKDFNNKFQRKPSDEEIEKYKKNWLNEEVMYQEGVRLGLDKSDPVIRQRVIKKMNELIQAERSILEPSDKDLIAYYNSHKDRYKSSASYSFILANINSIPLENRDLSNLDIKALETEYKLFFNQENHKKESLIKAKYGEPLIKNLSTGSGWFIYEYKLNKYLIKLLNKTNAGYPEFSEIANELKIDWKRDQQAQNIKTQIKQLTQQYEVIDNE